MQALWRNSDFLLIFFFSTSGDIPYVDLGCFVDTGNPSTMPEMLLTDTDSHSPLFSGVPVKRDIKDWDDYMSNLICRYVFWQSFLPLRIMVTNSMMVLFSLLYSATYTFIFYSCAQITNQKGYSHFGIQNLGECRSGFNVDKTYASQGARVAFSRQGPRPWVGCLGKGMKQCSRPSLSCVGQDQTNYVYGLKNSKYCWSLAGYLMNKLTRYGTF